MGDSRSRWTAFVLASFAPGILSGCIMNGDSGAADFVSSETYTRLMVEVDYADGAAPRDGALNTLKVRMMDRLSKPGGIEFQKTPIAGTRDSYSVKDLQAVERQNRDYEASGDRAALYVLYIDGHFAEDTDDKKVLGLHYGSSTVVIFKATIESSGGILGLTGFAPSDIEEAVLVHEFGHAIGLVNLGLKMVRPHEDPDHPGHSNSRDSVMYWAIEDTFGLKSLTGTLPDNFDDDDIADIRGAGGR